MNLVLQPKRSKCLTRANTEDTENSRIGRNTMKSKRTFGVIGMAVLAGVVVMGMFQMGAFSQSPAPAPAVAAPVLVPEGSAPASFAQLLKASQAEKKGLTFYVNGQVIGGAVVRASGDGTVEIRNQEFGKILIRLDRVDAIASH